MKKKLQRDGGKGSTPRPIPDWDTYEDNWDRIFGKQQEEEQQQQEEQSDKEN